MTISYNNFSGNQGGASNTGSMAGVFFDGNATTWDTNLVLDWNTFGAQGNCSNAMTQQVDQGGLCSAILFQNSNTNVTANNNKVAYQEEGFKILPQRYCANCTFDNNDFSNIHRIAIEFQIFTAKGPLFISTTASTILWMLTFPPWAFPPLAASMERKRSTARSAIMC